MNFSDLGLGAKTVQAINGWGFEKPTTVQADVIPAILQGKDIFTIAPGGCGKTISYILPLIDIISQNNAQSILIMTSDSKKSVMISDYLSRLNKFHEEDETNEDNNDKEADVIIGSPDLLLDLASENEIDLSKVNILVVDDINLIKKNKQIENMEKVLEMLPADKQNIVYTNRRSRETQDILDKILKAPQEIKVDRTKEEEAKKTATQSRPEKSDNNQTDNKKDNRSRRENRPNKDNAVNDKSKCCSSDMELDDKALELVKKYNSFNGKTPNFLLCKVEPAVDTE